MRKNAGEPPIEIPEHQEPKKKPVRGEGHRSRMFDRLFKWVDYAINQRDLLEILLYFSIARADTRDRAVYLMALHDEDIQKVIHAETATLTRVPGIGDKTANMLRMVGACVDRIMHPEPSAPKPVLSQSEAIEAFIDRIPPTDHIETWAAVYDEAMYLQDLKKILDREMTGTPNDLHLLHEYTTGNLCHRVIVAKVFPGDKRTMPMRSDIILAANLSSTLNRCLIFLHEYLVLNDVGYIACLQSSYM